MNSKVTTFHVVFRGYEKPPKPIASRFELAARAFGNSVLTMLKSKALANGYIAMDLDIWSYVVEGRRMSCEHRGHFRYQKEDLDRFLKLLSDW